MTNDIKKLVPNKPPEDERRRTLALTKASTIEMRPVFWLWRGRIPLGELTLVAGREGIGKSTLVNAELVAWITTGTMKGVHIGVPKSVIIAATEDSWEHTIVPRLVGAGADLERVLRCEVTTERNTYGTLTLPSDICLLERQIREQGDVVALVLDPLMSRLSGSLDSHKDAEVRIALEPLTAFAKKMNIAVVGLIHVNKSAGTDPLNLIMASRAFPAVARSVLFAIRDPANESHVLLGLEKNNLGSTNVPTYRYEIGDKLVGHWADPVDGRTHEIRTGIVNWLGESDKSISEALETTIEGGVQTAVDDAAMWLEDYLQLKGCAVDSMEVKSQAKMVGHSESALQRARKRLPVVITSAGMPRHTFWSLVVISNECDDLQLVTVEPINPF